MLSLHLTSDSHGPSQSFPLSFQKNASPVQSVMRISLILPLSDALSLPSFQTQDGNLSRYVRHLLAATVILDLTYQLVNITNLPKLHVIEIIIKRVKSVI